MRLSQTEGDAVLASDRAVDHGLLVVATVTIEHSHDRQIADDRMLVLQIIVQAEALRGEMLADHGHPEVGAVLAAIALRNRETQMAGRIGAILGLTQQLLPLMPRQPAILKIGPRPFAAMIKKTDVVVGLLQRLDLGVDEAIELVEIGDELPRQGKIHGVSPWSFCSCL